MLQLRTYELHRPAPMNWVPVLNAKAGAQGLVGALEVHWVQKYCRARRCRQVLAAWLSVQRRLPEGQKCSDGTPERLTPHANESIAGMSLLVSSEVATKDRESGRSALDRTLMCGQMRICRMTSCQQTAWSRWRCHAASRRCIKAQLSDHNAQKSLRKECNKGDRLRQCLEVLLRRSRKAATAVWSAWRSIAAHRMFALMQMLQRGLSKLVQRRFVGLIVSGWRASIARLTKQRQFVLLRALCAWHLSLRMHRGDLQQQFIGDASNVVDDSERSENTFERIIDPCDTSNANTSVPQGVSFAQAHFARELQDEYSTGKIRSELGTRPVPYVGSVGILTQETRDWLGDVEWSRRASGKKWGQRDKRAAKQSVHARSQVAGEGYSESSEDRPQDYVKNHNNGAQLRLAITGSGMSTSSSPISLRDRPSSPLNESCTEGAYGILARKHEQHASHEMQIMGSPLPLVHDEFTEAFTESVYDNLERKQHRDIDLQLMDDLAFPQTHPEDDRMVLTHCTDAYANSEIDEYQTLPGFPGPDELIDVGAQLQPIDEDQIFVPSPARYASPVHFTSADEPVHFSSVDAPIAVAPRILDEDILVSHDGQDDVQIGANRLASDEQEYSILAGAGQDDASIIGANRFAPSEEEYSVLAGAAQDDVSIGANGLAPDEEYSIHAGASGTDAEQQELQQQQHPRKLLWNANELTEADRVAGVANLSFTERFVSGWMRDDHEGNVTPTDNSQDAANTGAELADTSGDREIRRPDALLATEAHTTQTEPAQGGSMLQRRDSLLQSFLQRQLLGRRIQLNDDDDDW